MAEQDGNPQWVERAEQLAAQWGHPGLDLPDPRRVASRRPGGYAFVLPPEPGWIWVVEGGLGHPLAIKIGRRGNRLAVVGLMIDGGDDESPEVNAATLRSIRLGEIIEQLAEAYVYPAASSAVLPKERHVERFAWLQRALAIGDASRPLPVSPPRQGKAPDDEQLARFAATYEHHRKTAPRRAMTLATEEAHMARSTGYRWLQMAEQRGLIRRTESEE